MEAFPIQDQKAETVARVMVEEVIFHHGAPECLLSNRGTNFLSELVAEVCRLLQIKKLNTSGYHPQTDGLVERFHHTLMSMLSKYVDKHARYWDRYLPYMLYAYRVMGIQREGKWDSSWWIPGAWKTAAECIVYNTKLIKYII